MQTIKLLFDSESAKINNKTVFIKQALTMKRSGTKTTTVGEIVNLMSVDCQRIQDSFLFSFYIVTLFVIIIVATAQLWDLMGTLTLLSALV